MEKEEFKHNIGNCAQWGRLLYMLLFGVILYVVIPVLCVIIIVQVVLVLVTSKTNENIRHFSTDLAHYVSQIILFLTYNENTKPFPFSDWESADNEPSEDDSMF